MYHLTFTQWHRCPTTLGPYDAHVFPQQVLLDVHNYARYRGSVIGESGGNVTAADFADLWSRIATKYGSTDKASPILFGLMNEPHSMKTTTVLANANAAIAAIRTAKAHNIITVCGNIYSGAKSWTKGGNDSNAAVMGGIVDPMDNFVCVSFPVAVCVVARWHTRLGGTGVLKTQRRLMCCASPILVADMKCTSISMQTAAGRTPPAPSPT